MQLDDMRSEFPKMPQEIRGMVRQEVDKQLKAGTAPARRRKGVSKKYVLVAFAAVMVMGMTALAGSLYRMRIQDNGKYGLDVSVERDGEDGTPAGEAQDGGSQENQEAFSIEPVKVTLSYLPEGMIQVEDDYGKYCYADAMYQGGVSVCLYRMDSGNEAFAMQFSDVADREELYGDGYEGVYLRFADLYEDEIVFNQRVYVMYPDRHYVLEMFAGSNVSKEDAIAIAEGIRLTPATEEECAKYSSVVNWSEYVQSMQEMMTAENTEDFSDEAMEVSIDRMNHTHAVGESFSLGDDQLYTVKVTQVQILDNIGVLNWDLLDADEKEELSEVTDADGYLLPGTMEYIRYGDGINTLTEVIRQEQVTQKLVYITLEYTNTGDTRLTDVLFLGSLLRMEEIGGSVRIFEGKEPDGSGQWDAARMRGAAGAREMFYYDVHGGGRGNNYIPAIEPGGTVTVHLAWVVPEEELPYLYLNLNTEGDAYTFSDSALETGYVDIRQ